MNKLGALLVFGAVVFAVLETAYFGWNWSPQSTAEWVCDIAAIVMTVCGWGLYTTK